MVRITKVYTKTGDKGHTQLAAGKKASKTSCRVAALGDLDELNAFLGLATSLLTTKNLSSLQKKLIRIQNELFDLGAQLSVLIMDRRKDTPRIQQADIDLLEQEIAAMNAHLPKLKSFVIPHGQIPSSLHIARTVCRRTERAVVSLSEIEKLDGTEIPYLNRLSDWLFVAARFVAAKLNITEILWEPGRRNF